MKIGMDYALSGNLEDDFTIIESLIDAEDEISEENPNIKIDHKPCRIELSIGSNDVPGYHFEMEGEKLVLQQALYDFFETTGGRLPDKVDRKNSEVFEGPLKKYGKRAKTKLLEFMFSKYVVDL